MSHRYIVSSTPYLVTTKPPIYKVPTRGNVANPNREPNGPVYNLIQIEREENDMLDIIIAPPQDDVEDVESEQELTIIIQPVQEEVREPVKTRKIRVGNKVAVVPIETATITIL